MSVGKQFFPDTWDKVCQCIRDIYLSSVPHQLITWKPDDNMMRRYVCMYVCIYVCMYVCIGCQCPNVDGDLLPYVLQILLNPLSGLHKKLIKF